MNRKSILGIIVIFALCSTGYSQRLMEKLGRGVVAVNQGEGKVFVSWRLLGTEPQDAGFNVYRSSGTAAPVKLNAQPLTAATSYLDSAADLTKDNAWFVRPVVNGAEGEMSKPFLNKIAANSEPKPYFEIPLKLPENTQAGDGSVGDLDGDGEYEIILKGVQQSRDTSSRGLTGNGIFQAYKLDGTLMWTIQMGLNVREGEHDAQYMVYDLDGDGRAELAVRTADGTIDGTGKVIGDPNAKWRDEDSSSNTFGRIMKGPEYFTIFDGRTGAALATTEYVPTRFPIDGWGGIGGSSGNDTNGNRLNRFLAAVAYLDGQRPSVIMCRGVYGRSVMAAWDWRYGKLTQRWVYDSSKGPNGGHPYVTESASVDPADPKKLIDDKGTWGGIQPGQWMIWDRDGAMERYKVMAISGKTITLNEPVKTPGQGKGAHVWGYSGMGGHSLSVADVDGDGKDDIVYNAMVVKSDGTGLHTTGHRHGDSLHVGNFDLDNPGLEVFGPHENEGREWDRFSPGAALFDALTGRTIWEVGRGQDVGRGLTGDIDPRHPGNEFWGVPGGLLSAKGQPIAPRGPNMTNFVVWWDGDLLREMVDGNRVAKWNWETSTLENILVAQGAQAAASTKSSPVVGADLFGDWREEVIFRAGTTALRVYTTTAPTEHRIHTLMHDPQYRMAICWQNCTYNQPPWPSFFIGHDMKAPPKPNIVTSK